MPSNKKCKLGNIITKIYKCTISMFFAIQLYMS